MSKELDVPSLTREEIERYARGDFSVLLDGRDPKVDAQDPVHVYWTVVAVCRWLVVLAALGYAGYVFFWGGAWGPFWVMCGVALLLEGALWLPCLPAYVEGRRLRRKLQDRCKHIKEMEARILEMRALISLKRTEHLQQEAYKSALRAEIAQLQAQCAAMEAKGLELERLEAQRRLEQEARESRRRLEIAVAAVEADRLEASAWRMEMTAKQLELKLHQADLFESLSGIEDKAQDRIIAAYEQGFDHGKRGIVISLKHLRHLRVVEESA